MQTINCFFVVSFTPKTVVLFPGGNVTFTCNDTSRVWIIGDIGTRRSDSELLLIDGVSSNGSMLIITQSVNNTLYGCTIVQDGEFITVTGIVYVASVYVCMYIYVFTSICMYRYTRTYVCMHLSSLVASTGVLFTVIVVNGND